MQLQMSFLEVPASRATPVWGVLDAEQQAEVVTALGRLIAKVAAPEEAEEPPAEKEVPDDE